MARQPRRKPRNQKPHKPRTKEAAQKKLNLDPELVAFGERLRALRHKAGMTQEELATAAEVHWTYIGQIERGERNLTYRNIKRLARGLKLDPGVLVSDKEVK